jgi:sulfonate transport system substrate-binding protein
VTADSTAASIEDLKGRKIAIFKGTASQLAAARILDAHGLSEKDLRVYNMDAGTASAAIASKDVEGIFSGVDLLALRDRGVAKIIFSVQGQEEKFSYVTSLLVTEEFAAKYPEITKRVVKVMLQAAQWSSEEQNRDPLFLLWAKSGTPFSHYKESYDGPLKLRNTPLLDDFFVARYKATVEDCKKFGLIRADVDVDQWIDRSFLEAVLQELNLLSYWQSYDANGKPQSVLAEAPRSGQ